jgi:hypothetical protein
LHRDKTRIKLFKLLSVGIAVTDPPTTSLCDHTVRCTHSPTLPPFRHLYSNGQHARFKFLTSRRTEIMLQDHNRNVHAIKYFKQKIAMFGIAHAFRKQPIYFLRFLSVNSGMISTLTNRTSISICLTETEKRLICYKA